MSLYEGLGVETAPLPEISSQTSQSSEQSGVRDSGIGGWSSSMKMMASHLERQKKAMRAAQQSKSRPLPSTAVLESSSLQGSSVTEHEPEELTADDLSAEIADEYDPLIPNSYEEVLNERKNQEKTKDEKVKRRREQKRKSSSDGSASDEEEKKKSNRKDSAAIPPPSSLTAEQQAEKKAESVPTGSALEELSKTKAKRTNPFMKPSSFSSTVASQIMTKYGWKEGQGLGKSSQGISTALSVEKTSKRGGKIVNVAAEREQQIEQEKKKVNSLAEMMKNPTKVILLQNMVGPGEVDDDLQPEVTEECSKYGEVTNCLIFEIPTGAADDEAVRIFVEFARLESAIKAVIDLNGRFFGGHVIKATFYSEDKFSRFDLAP